MFHTAGLWRSSLVIGSRFPLTGFTLRKSRMRCWSGLTPVSIVVQISGDKGGWMVFSFPLEPSLTSFASAGMAPLAMY